MPRRQWKDVLAPGLDVVFVGYNPSRLAWRTGHHYANPGNRFYHLLHDAGLTPRRFAPAECRELIGLGIGLADVLHEWSPRADDFPLAAYRAALPAFRRRLARAAPRAVMLNGIGIYRLLFDRTPPRLGRDPDARLGGAAVFVAPSSSGLANGRTRERLAAYSELARWLLARS
ncbi:MAG TPA: mismatch-specific DNA-glycosylase [Kofleriaceae bacterium]|nr:mismatch-specific DNA-glycosylase [Kofleriaceae bacterium]